ncbi:hypothetical protein MtrunA17_Chr4g0037571 [Medicago truncatula]|uniref:Uncharacterized protein n=1 Tax=Medicago truncatula TaxID=3880 RepID=A0A396I9V7_MEDTR|nr:hypothetical protein MtrunA17_Chr4g0037571 [Medicago truncatula]
MDKINHNETKTLNSLCPKKVTNLYQKNLNSLCSTTMPSISFKYAFVLSKSSGSVLSKIVLAFVITF